MRMAIKLSGARTHNLKNVSLSIPKQQLVVVTGPSGSGKSSLVFDTLYAEAQRRFLESAAVMRRTPSEHLPRAEVDLLEGLCPAVAVMQHEYRERSHATLGTLSEIYDYLRVLFSRIGVAHCPRCSTRIVRHSMSQILDTIAGFPKGTRYEVVTNVSLTDQSPEEVLERLRVRGFVRVLIDQTVQLIEEILPQQIAAYSSLPVVVDRLIARDDSDQTRIRASLELAVQEGAGGLRLRLQEDDCSPRFLDFRVDLNCPKCGFEFPALEPALFSFTSNRGACPYCSGLGETSEDGGLSYVCQYCAGSRLREEARCVLVSDQSIATVAALPIEELRQCLRTMSIPESDREVWTGITALIDAACDLLCKLGLGYLSVDRSLASLSRGEVQRARIARQLNFGLSGVLFALDEPSCGLHPREIENLLASLRQLITAGNSVILVEHDPQLIAEADWVIELGPGSGLHGGTVVWQGSGSEAVKRQQIDAPVVPVEDHLPGARIDIVGLRYRQFNDLSFSLPLGRLVCVAGVSGSGKSSLVFDVLCPLIQGQLSKTPSAAIEVLNFTCSPELRAVYAMDQKPLGRSERSNPATAVGLFSSIRALFAELPESRARGYSAQRFSFNRRGGRCDSCEGTGCRRIEMQFLPDLFLPCAECGGSRYNRDLLEITFRQKNIADVLAMDVIEAVDFFRNIPTIAAKLEVLLGVGLGYLKLGQAATTLSGGEAQRIKLARELAKNPRGNALYILDEPSAGLGRGEIHSLLAICRDFVARGDSLIVIEHNLDLLAAADYILELGPGAGVHGGRIVATGKLQDLRNNPESSFFGLTK